MSNYIGNIARTIVTEAIDAEAVGIRIELGVKRTEVYYQREGAMHRQMRLPAHLFPPLVTRYKIWANVDLLSRRYPLKGQFSLIHRRRHYSAEVIWDDPRHDPRVTMSIVAGAEAQAGDEDSTGIWVSEFVDEEKPHPLVLQLRLGAAPNSAREGVPIPEVEGRGTTGTGFGEFLVARHLLTEEHLRHACLVQQEVPMSLPHAVVALGYLTENEVLRAAAAYVGYPYVDLTHYSVDLGAISVLPFHVIACHKVLPLRKHSRVLVTATADPLNVLKEDHVRMYSELEVRWVVAAPDQIEAGIAKAVEAREEYPL